jgi:4-alpha-glucanotransferase
MNKRGSGILLHITSLPSENGMGNMGPGAYKFVDFLAQAGQRYWQVLPLNPPSPGEGNSPYSSSSAFAGNTLLISPETLSQEGLISSGKVQAASKLPKDHIDYKSAIEYKEAILEDAYQRAISLGIGNQLESFCTENSYWLFDFALFSALKRHFPNQSWDNWPTDIRDKEPDAVDYYSKILSEEIYKQKIWQFLFYRQWSFVKGYANKNNIKIVGDIPIYMSYQSADVWAHPEIFKLDEDKKPLFISGVPPDYFSKTGQLWGNPVYNWERLKETGFDWWLKRVEHNLKFFDILRIDHFRGLAAYWEVPAGEKTAINGKWVTVPGMDYFNKLREQYSSLPIIAEDLGIITDDVKKLMEWLGVPGMKVLLFTFGRDLPENPYAPHNYIKNCVVYTGTHDNNTARGWFENEATESEKESLRKYIGRDVSAENVSWELIKLAMTSVADIAILPMQDILNLGSQARMNLPSTTVGNWQWRLEENDITPDLIKRLKDLTYISGRLS